MNRNSLKYLSFMIIVLMSMGCGTSWTDAIKRGNISVQKFNSTVDVDVKFGLLIVPVEINGKTYRFLFDTGANTSISDKIQELNQFEMLTTGNLVDSQKSKTKAKYVSLDSIVINGISFQNQTAFVSDFTKNPVIACLKIDGIIGSNMMRFCDWTMDYKSEKITFTDNLSEEIKDSSIAIPFKTDKQYNIKVDLNVGEKLVKNMKIDYGSNGSFGLPNEHFNTLKNASVFENTFDIVGYSQSGLFGDKKEVTKQFGYAKISSSDLLIDTMEIISGKSGLIGGKLLSEWIVSIDWNDRMIYFSKDKAKDSKFDTFGFNVGYDEAEKLYVQSIITSSEAYKKGLRPNMQITKIDSIDINESKNYCDYFEYLRSGNDHLQLEVIGADKEIKKLYLTKENFISIKEEDE